MEVQPLNILLVEDHDLVSAGLRMIFENEKIVGKVEQATSGEQALALVNERPFDIIFMDIGLPGMDGLTTALRLLQVDENMRIIVLTGLSERPNARVVLQAGLRGYMTKSSATNEVSLAIASVMQGGTYLSKEIASQAALEDLSSGGKPDPLDILSRRELQVLLLLMTGHKPIEVGEMLLLSTKTVSTYKRRAFEKLRIDSFNDLLQIGLKSGFVGERR